MKKYTYDDTELSLMKNSCIPFAVYQYIDGHVVTIVLSKGFCDFFGFENVDSTYELMDNDMYRDCHPDDVARIADAAVRFATIDEPYKVVYRSKINGTYRIIHALGKHIYKDDIRLAIIWYFDEGEFQEQSVNKKDCLNLAFSNILHEITIHQSNRYDFLTGLPTITYFFALADAQFTAMMEKGENPVMLFLDLNGMKYFNLKYGFAEGDNLIRAFSRLLIEHFSHDNCCRFGMDSFCVYTNDKDLEDRLWKLFAECEEINGGKSLPVRVGIYCPNGQRYGVSFACDRAKMACDADKKSYLSHFTYFDETMLEETQMHRYVIDNIDRAIQEKWIKVHYQPIVRAANGRVCDEEALSRWIDPEKGMLTPDKFIPVLEDANLIYKLDLYVADEILRKMKMQEEAGLFVVPTSVNLSRSDFDTCDIVSEIQKRVEASGIPKEKLTIEITESIIGNNYDYMKTQIEKFQSLGFKVWMDEFGTGYSSIDILQDIKFDLIKFDMKFMRQFHKNEKTKIILSSLMKMVMGLGIETVCEGVETEDQVAFLKEIGCTKLQGFYYCKPIPLESIFERYEKGTQIGFENPAESDYYATIGRINLYDLSVVTNCDDAMFKDFFNTIPMSILEANENELRIIRGNKTYKDFIKKYYAYLQKDRIVPLEQTPAEKANLFLQTIRHCQKDTTPVIIDEILPDGTKIHVYVRRIAENPITHVTAIVSVILGISGL